MACKKQKAQAGLEYLMTYGWALIILVTVASVLFFVVSPPSQNTVFFNSNSANFVVRSSNVGSGSGAAFTLQLQNASGKPVVITALGSSKFSFNPPYNNCGPPVCNILVSSGQVMNITGNVSPSYADSGTIGIQYKIDNYTKTMAISARGKIPSAT
jgi:uncharacterized protein (UPF0333 family)